MSMEQQLGQEEAMLNWTTQNLGDVAVFRLNGKILAGSGIDLVRSVAAQNAPRVMLDLAEVQAIDAAGLGTLIAVQSWAKSVGSRLKLMNVTPTIEALLRLTKLDGLFEVCSLSEMLDLICRATNVSFAAAAVGQGSVSLSQDSEAA